jgi:beta-lactamase class A
LFVAVYYDAPSVGMDAREAVLREAGTVFVQWATSAA